jgi:hypothetical protein
VSGFADFPQGRDGMNSFAGEAITQTVFAAEPRVRAFCANRLHRFYKQL